MAQMRILRGNTGGRHVSLDTNLDTSHAVFAHTNNTLKAVECIAVDAVPAGFFQAAACAANA